MPMFQDCWQRSPQTDTHMYVTGSCAQATRSNCYQWLTAGAFSRWHKISAQFPSSEAKRGLCLLPSGYERRCSTNIAAGCGQRAHANATPSALEAALASAWETDSWLALTYLGVRENYFLLSAARQRWGIGEQVTSPCLFLSLRQLLKQ